MTQKQLRAEIEKNIQFWTRKEILDERGLLVRANITVKGVKEGELSLKIFFDSNRTFVVFKPQFGNEIDIKSYDGTYSNIENGKESGLDFVVRYLADKYK